ncbi:MAG: dihydroxy-acid dehydratase [Alphaproteobacteria bacterium]
MIHPVIEEVTRDIRIRSTVKRAWYLDQTNEQRRKFESNELGPRGRADGCSNCAHSFAAAANDEKKMIMSGACTLAMIDSGNEEISSGQPYEAYRAIIRDEAKIYGAVAKVAGGVPAMCDGVTQGFDGMELSLFSRNTVAQSTVVSLAVNTHDGVFILGECDKIFPGLVMGVTAFGHLPVISIPSGPMKTGISNAKKNEVRQKFKKNEVGERELQMSENQSYHSPGVCTFFGTANTNKAVAEAMGLVLPGSSFVNPTNPLRDALTRDSVRRMAQGEIDPLMDIIDERSFVNAMVVLMAMGGSTNHTMHIPAMAAQFGIDINWDDMDRISSVVPLIAKIYPNGKADINDFREAGGMAVIIRNLLDAGLLHEDVNTVAGHGLERYTQTPVLDVDTVKWTSDIPERLDTENPDTDIIRKVDSPFAPDGGIKLVQGTLGRAVIKTSAVKDEHRVIKGFASIFDTQKQFHRAFEAWQKKTSGAELNEEEKILAAKLDKESVVVVLRGQSARHNGMPELHGLINPLDIMQKTGKRVALITDGRLSGASGAVLAAINLHDQNLFRIHDNDELIIDSITGKIDIDLDEVNWLGREPTNKNRIRDADQYGIGRQFFFAERTYISSPEKGCIMPLPPIPEYFQLRFKPYIFESPEPVGVTQ